MQLVGQLREGDGALNWTGHTLELLDVIFTSCFTVELLLNAFAYWFWAFAGNGSPRFPIPFPPRTARTPLSLAMHA
jgi:hypothetical protein